MAPAMAEVPESPEEFFNTYVPSRFAEVQEKLEGKSSAGSIVFRVGAEEFALRLNDGKLDVSKGMTDDAVMQVTVSEADFVPIVVEGARGQEEKGQRPESQMAADKIMSIDQAKADLIRGVKGTLCFAITDAGETRKISMTPGVAEPNLESPECELQCQMSDFIEMQGGQVNPMQLTMQGKLKIVGNAQIPMALMGMLT